MIEMKQREGCIVRCFPEQQYNSAYEVTVTDACGNLVSSGETCREGIFRFSVPALEEYHIKVEGSDCFCPKVAHCRTCLSPCRYCILDFKFHKEPIATTATFTLTDQNYAGLPIQKGELYLWSIPIIL